MSGSRQCGVIANHTNNHTTFTREGHAAIKTYNDIPQLKYDPSLEYNEYENIHPGLYRVEIDGTMYAFIVHDDLTKDDRLIIKSQYDIFEIDNVTRKDIILYEIHDGLPIEQYGHPLNNTVNDKLDILVCHGMSRYLQPLNFNLPGSIRHLTKLNIRIRDRFGNIIDQELPLKSNLKSIGNVEHDRSYVSDILYLDGYKNKALYELKLGELRLSGMENIVHFPDMSNNSRVMLWIPNGNVKINSKIESTHLIYKPYDKFISDTNYIGISTGNSIDTQGIWMAIPKREFVDLDSFRFKLEEWYLSDSPIKIIYELTVSQYKHILLDTYKIALPFGHCHIIVTPFNEISTLDNIYDNVWYMPISGIIDGEDEITTDITTINTYGFPSEDTVVYLYEPFIAIADDSDDRITDIVALQDIGFRYNFYDNLVKSDYSGYIDSNESTLVDGIYPIPEEDAIDYISYDWPMEGYINGEHTDSILPYRPSGVMNGELYLSPEEEYVIDNQIVYLPTSGYIGKSNDITDGITITDVLSYDKILDELYRVKLDIDDSEYWDNVYVSADINVPTIYFYKHLNLGI